MEVVQYKFTHKKYTEQTNDTEYPERNIHKNKDTCFKIHIYIYHYKIYI